jgi:heme oxygenase
MDDDDLTAAERVELDRLEAKTLDYIASTRGLHAEVDELTMNLDAAYTADEFSDETANLHRWRRRVAERLNERT